jgi:hypothetical protein
MTWISKSMLVVLASVLSACNDGSMTIHADGKKFKIPKEYGVTSVPVWLPRLQRNEFLFVLNPAAEMSDHVIISGQPRSEFCSAKRTDYVRNLCSSVTTPWLSEYSFPSLKKIDGDDGVNWRYELPLSTTRKTRVTVAYCSGVASEPTDGICSSDGFFDDLQYTIGFKESRLSDLATFHRRVQAKLKQWELY